MTHVMYINGPLHFGDRSYAKNYPEYLQRIGLREHFEVFMLYIYEMRKAGLLKERVPNDGYVLGQCPNGWAGIPPEA